MKKLMLSALLASAPLFALAGSPDGLQLLVLGTSQASAAQPKVAQYLAEYEKSQGNFDCDDIMLNIGSAMQKPVSAISPEKALLSVSDNKQRTLFSKALASYRDPQHKRGFDGALLYDVQNGSLKIYGISAWTKEKIHRSEVKSSDWDNKEKFRLAMCRAMAEMPVLQEP
ncbi:hypothetical protein [Pseudoduganella violaceinigra]|uniref:hypothetical protein n=1 Tax=Pseudoduganella violaceinigra TaxID=246602 RepID=UPI0012B5DD08|nr:hypothetical protein [Pseudoduganella violaceinigra]